MNEITIRRAVAADAPRLTELAQLAKASHGYPPEWMEAWREGLTITADYLEAHRGFVAEREGLVAGCSILEDHGEHWLIEHVWVDPEAQGHGIGRRLVERVLAEAASIRSGRVMVLSDPFAEAFYRRLGGRFVGHVPAPMPGAPERTLPMLELAV